MRRWNPRESQECLGGLSRNWPSTREGESDSNDGRDNQMPRDTKAIEDSHI